MITPDQLQAVLTADTVSGDLQYTPLTEGDQLLLENLVKSYPPYMNAVGRWPSLSDKIDAEQTTVTMKTYFLKAVLAALNELPELEAESSGTDTSPGFFSTAKNWGILAQDVLNTLYDMPVVLGQQNWVLIQRSVPDLLLKEDIFFGQDKTGRRY